MRRIFYMLLAFVSVQFVYADEWGNMMYPGHMFWNFGFMGMILFLAAVIFLIYWLVKKSTETTQNSKQPIDILKERYAKGEITNKEFEEKKKELEK
ncbi:MAG: SHOCT domain-containing protein [Nanoarchaeota archaeon]